MNDGKHWFDKTVDSVKKASEAGLDLVQRNYQRATMKVDLAALRRTLDGVSRDLGRVAVDRLRERGQLSAEEVSHLLRRVDDLEDQIAAKERLLADLEEDASGKAPDPAVDDESTNPGGRRGPSFSPRDPKS